MKISRTLLPALTFFALLLAGGLSLARADISLTFTQADFLVSSAADGGADSHHVQTNIDGVASLDQTFSVSSTSGLSSASTKVEQHTKTTLVGTDALTFTSSGVSDFSCITVGGTNDVGEGTGSGSRFSISIDSTQRMSFVLSGSVAVETAGEFHSCDAEVVFHGQGDEDNGIPNIDLDFHASDTAGGQRTVTVTGSGVCQRGGCNLQVSLGIGSDPQHGQHTGRAKWDVTLNLVELPAAVPGTKHEWNRSTGGVFSDANNWSPAGVPVKTDTQADTAVFPLAKSGTVDLGTGGGRRVALCSAGYSRHTYG